MLVALNTTGSERLGLMYVLGDAQYRGHIFSDIAPRWNLGSCLAIGEFGEIYPQARIGESNIEKYTGEVTHGQSIGLSYFAEEIGRGRPTCSSHIVNDDGRTPGINLARCFAASRPSISVGATP